MGKRLWKNEFIIIAPDESRLARLLPAALVLLAFGRSLTATFHFDDHAILNDPRITAPGGWLELWRPAQTRPLAYFTFWLSYRLGGAHPAGYHAVSLALHLAATLLLVDILRRLLGARTAIVAASLFGIHPIQTEAVVYVYQRSTLLAAVFCLVAWRAWLAGGHRASVIWFAVALLAKEECAAFPGFLFLLELSRSERARAWRPLAAMFGLALAAGLRVLWATTEVPGAGAGAAAGISWRDYFAAQGPVIWRYLRLLVIPYGFTVDPQIDLPPLWLAAAAWLGLLALGAMAALRFHSLGAGFWLLGGFALLLPSSSVFPAEDLAADRRMYLPLVSFAPAIALLFRRADLRQLAPLGAVLVLLTAGRVAVWQTEERLWTEAVERAPGKVRPLLQLARVVDDERALALLERAKALAPDDPRVASEKGRRLLAMGRAAGALAEFGRALALEPSNAAALNNRGAALLALGQREAARADFERALKLDPCLEAARRNLLAMGSQAPPSEACPFPEPRRVLEPQK